MQCQTKFVLKIKFKEKNSFSKMDKSGKKTKNNNSAGSLLLISHTAITQYVTRPTSGCLELVVSCVYSNWPMLPSCGLLWHYKSFLFTIYGLMCLSLLQENCPFRNVTINVPLHGCNSCSEMARCHVLQTRTLTFYNSSDPFTTFFWSCSDSKCHNSFYHKVIIKLQNDTGS